MVLSKQALVPYTPAQMFALVRDVESYPEFVPWCLSGDVVSAYDDGVEARLTFAYAQLQYAFTTRNHYREPHEMTMTLVEGPLKRLHGCWLFSDVPGGCQVTFDVAYAFHHAWLGQAFERMLAGVLKDMVGIFCRHADQVYHADR